MKAIVIFFLGAVLIPCVTGTAAEQAKDDFRPLFDGKTLAGWKAEGGGTWAVENGAIVGRNKADQPVHGHLFTKDQYGDFTARLKFKNLKGNSGFYFRVAKVKGNIGVKGFQAEIDAANDVGGLYETLGRAWVVQPKPEFVKTYFKPGEWNEMTVEAHGGHLVVYVNGTKSAEVKDDTKGNPQGYLALQVHGGMDCEVLFKDLEIQGKPVGGQ